MPRLVLLWVAAAIILAAAENSTLGDYTPMCNTITSCDTCSMTPSGFAVCRWCPRDSKCHAYGSLANPCSAAENIVDPTKCNQAPLPAYDPNIAQAMLYFSSLAYSSNASTCAAKMSPLFPGLSAYHMYEPIVVADCDWGGLIPLKPEYHDCAVFVAVSDKDKNIVVSFRGSTSPQQVMFEALENTLSSFDTISTDIYVAHYWNAAFTKLENAGLSEQIRLILINHPDYTLYVTGHSLGGALASLFSFIAASPVFNHSNIVEYTFGAPRVGTHSFAMWHDKLVKTSFRVVQNLDIVPHLPPCDKFKVHGFKVPVCVATSKGMYHHGVEVFYGPKQSNINSGWVECHGLPHNEDSLSACSNLALATIGVLDYPYFFEHFTEFHKIYFGLDVGGFCSS